jgi:hypothetical protein
MIGKKISDNANEACEVCGEIHSHKPASDGTFDVHLVAQLLDITPRRLQQLAASGWFEKPKHGRYYLVKTVQGYVAYLRQRAREAQRRARETGGMGPFPSREV